MKNLNSVKCRYCGKFILPTKDFFFRQHKTRDGVVCAGSGRYASRVKVENLNQSDYLSPGMMGEYGGGKEETERKLSKGQTNNVSGEGANEYSKT